MHFWRLYKSYKNNTIFQNLVQNSKIKIKKADYADFHNKNGMVVDIETRSLESVHSILDQIKNDQPKGNRDSTNPEGNRTMNDKVFISRS